jgi:hypothetical protein
VHDGESGIMTNKGSGRVVIEHFKLERLDVKVKGEAHAVYITADELIFRYNLVLSIKKKGSISVNCRSELN